MNYKNVVILVCIMVCKLQAMDVAVELPSLHKVATGAEQEGITPLHYAAKYGHSECIPFLKYIGIEARDKNFRTPLHVASLYGQEQCIYALLKLGASLESKAKYGYRPLHIAAQFGNVECVRVLVASRAEVNCRSVDGYTPLHYAVTPILEDGDSKDPAFVFDPPSRHGKKCHQKCSQKVACVKLLVAAGANLENEGDDTPLHEAVAAGCTECARVLLESGADRNAERFDTTTPLELAVLTFQPDSDIRVLFEIESLADLESGPGFERASGCTIC